MIIVRVIGGLGNQMFQYALALKIARESGLIVKLDISGFGKYILHKYSLQNLAITLPAATSVEVNTFLALNKFFKGFRPFVIREGSNLYNPKIVNVSDFNYLDGHWQTEKYFSDIKELIRHDFKVTTKPNNYTKILLEEIQSKHSVSIHIRRADYVSDASANRILGTCSPEYYQKAIKYLEQKIHQFHIYIFSDDILWAKNNLKFAQKTTFVDGNNADNNYDDLRLMSQCKDNIIANSTFSWWGAWLNSNPRKIVIAPRKWYKDQSLSNRDIIPSDWLRI